MVFLGAVTADDFREEVALRDLLVSDAIFAG